MKAKHHGFFVLNRYCFRSINLKMCIQKKHVENCETLKLRSWHSMTSSFHVPQIFQKCFRNPFVLKKKRGVVQSQSLKKQTKPNQTKPSQTKPNQTKPSQTKPSQAKPSQQTNKPTNQQTNKPTNQQTNKPNQTN